MAWRQRREIKKVRFDGIVGYVTADQLLSVKVDMWHHWRTMLTMGWQDKSKGYKARCVLCDGRVYIAQVSSRDESQPIGRRVAPCFKHFGGQGTNCPWHTGEPLNPDEVRRLQYGGNQESDLHKNLCRTIFELISADTRCTKSLCDEYLPTNAVGQRRKPDAYAELAGLKPMAFELQLSNTNQPEIVERTTFYNQEGIGLIWIFHGVQPDKEKLPASLNDVVYNQRNNAFVLDFEARMASLEQQTLVLKCYRKTDTGLDTGQLIRVDQLIIPEKGCMYFEDRLAATLLRDMAKYRTKWESALEGLDAPELTDRVRAGLRHLAKELPGLDFHSDGTVLIKFIASVLTIIADAKGTPKKYASRQPNVTAMLNTYLNASRTTGLVRYAVLLEKLIQSTSNKVLL